VKNPAFYLVCFVLVGLTGLITHRFWHEFRSVPVEILSSEKSGNLTAIQSANNPVKSVSEINVKSDLQAVRKKLAWHFPMPYSVVSVQVCSTTNMVVWVDNEPIVRVDLSKMPGGKWKIGDTSSGHWDKGPIKSK
jgi:hypothetical protein